MPTLIDLPHQDRGIRLFFEHSSLGVRNLAFQTPEPTPPSGSLALNQPLSQYPTSTFFESYFYSAASLDGVDKIVPCQRYIRGRRHIIGLLLKFPDDRQFCLGQIHLDSLDTSFQGHSHQNVWLGFSTDDHRPFVSTLTLSEPKFTEGLSWLEVQLRGILEWWFSLRQCQVFYMGNQVHLLGFNASKACCRYADRRDDGAHPVHQGESIRVHWLVGKVRYTLGLHTLCSSKVVITACCPPPPQAPIMLTA